MRSTYSNLPPKRLQCAATIGVFDGVHRGHRFILDKLKTQAKKAKLTPLVITFDSPAKKLLLKKFYGCITDPKEKINIIKSFGIPCVWVLKTSKELLNISAEEFIKRIMERLNIKKLIIGEDFRFGKGRSSGIKLLKELSKKYDFDLTVVSKKKIKGRVVSSTLIRELIKKSDFKRMEHLLGRKYSLNGKVVKGKGVGRKIGFPTVNIHTFDHVIPPRGVYASVVEIDKKKYLGAFNIGWRPTVDNTKAIIIEGYIVGFRRNVLSKAIKVVFLERIRPEKKFSSLKVLQKAIKQDVDYITSKYSSLLQK